MKRSLIILATLATTLPAYAELPNGVKQIILRSASGVAVRIGHVTFSGDGQSRAFAVSMDDQLFKDHFLSMRPFKCLEGTEKFYCHLPYPYAVKGIISQDDLTDLEYALLFVQKQPQAYGINLWHGVYYKMTMINGGGISGTLHDVDMDILASPPAEGDMRPIKTSDIAASPPDANWLPSLSIE